MGAVLGVFLFLILGLAGPIILLLSFLYSRSWAAVISCGVVACVIMVLECLLIDWLAGIGSATGGGQAAYGVLLVAICYFGLCLLFYFTGAIIKLRK